MALLGILPARLIGCDVSFDNLTAVTIKIGVFCDMPRCQAETFKCLEQLCACFFMAGKCYEIRQEIMEVYGSMGLCVWFRIILKCRAVRFKPVLQHATACAIRDYILGK